MEIVIYGYTRTHKAREAAQIFFTHFSPRLIWVKLSVSLSELLGGEYLFGLAALVTGRQFPISFIPIKKFCADNQIAADKLHQTGFRPPYSLEQGLERKNDRSRLPTQFKEIIPLHVSGHTSFG